MHRFYVQGNPTKGAEFQLSDASQIKQISAVLRLHAGERVVLFAGDGFEYHGAFTVVSSKEVRVMVQDKKQGIGFSKEVTLVQALAKKDKLEWVVQKATELGVRRVRFVLTQRCVKNDMSSAQFLRLRQIAVEAAEQSGAAVVPEIDTEVITFKQLLNEVSGDTPTLLASEDAREGALEDFMSASKLTLIIGPEGGFDSSEVAAAIKRRVHVITLGNRILRTETAALAALSKLLI